MIGYILSTFLVSLGIAKAVGYKGWRGPIILSVIDHFRHLAYFWSLVSLGFAVRILFLKASRKGKTLTKQF